MRRENKSIDGVLKAEEAVRKKILEKGELTDEEVIDMIEEELFRSDPGMSPDGYEEAVFRIFGRIRSRLGPLYRLAGADHLERHSRHLVVQRNKYRV